MSITSPQPPSLSVVFPAYNEVNWIGRSVQAVLAASRAANWNVEIVVIDDGSTDGTAELLDELADAHGVVVVHQANRGRFETVRTAIKRATSERVLILGSRVVVDEHSLAFLKSQMLEHPDRLVWNGHVRVETEGNPFAGFWKGILQILWRRYLKEPRLTSFGINDFDLFPKGSGFFCAPKEILEEGLATFDSIFDDVRFVSDDTRLIRSIAERHRIWIAPQFSCSYFHGRENLRGFATHAYFRGTTFIDGYLGQPGLGRRIALVAIGAGAAGTVLAFTRPKAALVTGTVGALAAGAAVREAGGSPADARAVAVLMPVFAGSFGACAVRGLLLALRARMSRSRS